LDTIFSLGGENIAFDAVTFRLPTFVFTRADIVKKGSDVSRGVYAAFIGGRRSGAT
jgi:hypothetical protein